jgi:hypothetical protein
LGTFARRLVFERMVEDVPLEPLGSMLRVSETAMRVLRRH